MTSSGKTQGKHRTLRTRVSSSKKLEKNFTASLDRSCTKLDIPKTGIIAVAVKTAATPAFVPIKRKERKAPAILGGMSVGAGIGIAAVTAVMIVEKAAAASSLYNKAKSKAVEIKQRADSLSQTVSHTIDKTGDVLSQVGNTTGRALDKMLEAAGKYGTALIEFPDQLIAMVHNGGLGEFGFADSVPDRPKPHKAKKDALDTRAMQMTAPGDASLPRPGRTASGYFSSNI